MSELPDGTVTENLSLDGQGRVEDHWIQTELGGVTYLDTEPWRGEPLLTYLQKMVFWAKVAVEPADLAVLSLLGPRLADAPVLEALGVDSLPAQRDGGGAARRRFRPPDAGSRRSHSTSWCRTRQAAQWRQRLVDAGRAARGCVGLRGAPGRLAAPAAGVDTDERTIPHEVGWIGAAVHLDKGCYRGQETVARVHNLGKPPRMLVSAASRRLDRPTGHRRPGAGRRANGGPARHRRRPRRRRARSRWLCSSARCPRTRN